MKIVLLALLALSALAADLRTLVSARAISITNTGATPIFSPLEGATAVQVYIRPSSSAQVFTLTLVDGTTVEVPSGNTFTLRVGASLRLSDRLFNAQTATSTAVLQVVGFREVR